MPGINFDKQYFIDRKVFLFVANVFSQQYMPRNIKCKCLKKYHEDCIDKRIRS